MKPHLGISVIVCTYNRSRLLADALQSLCEQTLSSSKFEIIVVDNNSRDDTRTVMEEYIRYYPNVRYCFEPQQGLSHARNRGWQNAQGEYVAYVDDDCRMPPGWLAMAQIVIKQIAPGAFGGPYFPFYNSTKPHWYKDEYATHDLGAQAHVLSTNEFITGGNFFIRHAVLEALGGFDPALGMSGKLIGYGEETVLLRRMRKEMPDQIIYYEPRLYIHHLVPAGKMTWRWIIRSAWSDGRYAHRIFGNWPVGSERFIWQFYALRQIYYFGKGLAAHGVFFRDHQRYPCFENYLYEQGGRLIKTLGALYEKGRKYQDFLRA